MGGTQWRAAWLKAVQVQGPGMDGGESGLNGGWAERLSLRLVTAVSKVICRLRWAGGR